MLTVVGADDVQERPPHEVRRVGAQELARRRVGVLDDARAVDPEHGVFGALDEVAIVLVAAAAPLGHEGNRRQGGGENDRCYEGESHCCSAKLLSGKE